MLANLEFFDNPTTSKQMQSGCRDSDHEPELTSAMQSVSCNSQPTIFTQQPANCNQQPDNSSQQPVASSQQPATVTQQPATPNHQPATSTFQPVVVTDELIIAAQQSATSTHQPATSNMPYHDVHNIDVRRPASLNSELRSCQTQNTTASSADDEIADKTEPATVVTHAWPENEPATAAANSTRRRDGGDSKSDNSSVEEAAGIIRGRHSTTITNTSPGLTNTPSSSSSYKQTIQTAIIVGSDDFLKGNYQLDLSATVRGDRQPVGGPTTGSSAGKTGHHCEHGRIFEPGEGFPETGGGLVHKNNSVLQQKSSSTAAVREAREYSEEKSNSAAAVRKQRESSEGVQPVVSSMLVKAANVQYIHVHSGQDLDSKVVDECGTSGLNQVDKDYYRVLHFFLLVDLSFQDVKLRKTSHS